jgi:hypothetical protein
MPALAKEDVTVCEFGGANSCFVDDFLRLGGVKYHVIDNNRFGCTLLTDRYKNDRRVVVECLDVLSFSQHVAEFDVVYSVGLIEHFDISGTCSCIEKHFLACKPGGIVLISFPTSTLLYRAIRSIAEATGRWMFPDERPLTFEEVCSTADRFGECEHKSINWWIGLTQGYVRYRVAAP